MRRRRPDELTPFTGQTAGLVHDVLPAAETVREIVDAANNPIGRSDPLGLRPVTDRELEEIRNHMGRGGIQKVVDGALGISGAVSAATAVAALACAPIPGRRAWPWGSAWCPPPRALRRGITPTVTATRLVQWSTLAVQWSVLQASGQQVPRLA